MNGEELMVKGERFDVANYRRCHRKRITLTLDAIRMLGGKRIVELGEDPWVMTSALLDEGAFEVAATLSVEEVTNWPDDLGVTRREYRIKTLGGREMTFPNYSVNVERTLFELQEKADTVIACEIIEHLLRSPHIMLLNINRWLPVGGKLLITTPNGAQFNNPLRRKSARPAYRCNVYGRHNYLFTLAQLVDIAELCGFRVVSSGFWKMYQRTGPSQLYDALGTLPFRYFQEKFQRTIYIAAEKTRDVIELDRLPSCYAPSAGWEFIRQVGKSSGQSNVFEE